MIGPSSSSFVFRSSDFRSLSVAGALRAAFAAAAVATVPLQAFAQGAPAQGPGLLMNMVPIVFMLAVFYFLIMRPQMKKQKELQAFLENLKHGDSVVTNAGIFGVIREIQGPIVTLEISQGVRVKFLRSQIGQSAEMVAKSAVKSSEAKA